MRDMLADVVKHSTLFDEIVVVGSTDQTRFQGSDKDKVLILDGTLTQPVPELSGAFGIGNLSLLGKLLDLPSYQTDGGTIHVKRHAVRTATGTDETVELFRFVDGSGLAPSVFRCKRPEAVLSEVRSIPWKIDFRLTKSKVAEITKFASLFKEVGNLFSLRTKDNHLIMMFGEDSASNHYGTVIIADDIDGEIKGDAKFNIDHFLHTLRMSEDALVQVSDRGIMGVELTTPHALYKFYLRATT